jgi:hypothetical protein
MSDKEHGNVVVLQGAACSKSRRELARWLREIAGDIESDVLETEPHAAILVLTGPEWHEMVSAGYSKDGHGFDGAVNAAYSIGSAHYQRQGGNLARRDHPKYGRPYRSDNVVQFDPPRKRSRR